ncbi:hypothetical protein BGZ61DRAFT_445964 [Ilyonectria robusta]|uniref:uncharacterized protein n=1 Tax=Ilyonectria robusta TaxID=1079257 RepID=UPI001E8D3E3E|nr:uncharacterized protein BGZ61DRAFT_445964 [Ilyonectria robusta]KAH8729194.1 hypothetical protein BGZ61DRAFT_445964 [Ilyonectria robusta]
MKWNLILGSTTEPWAGRKLGHDKASRSRVWLPACYCAKRTILVPVSVTAQFTVEIALCLPFRIVRGMGLRSRGWHPGVCWCGLNTVSVPVSLTGRRLQRVWLSTARRWLPMGTLQDMGCRDRSHGCVPTKLPRAIRGGRCRVGTVISHGRVARKLPRAIRSGRCGVGTVISHGRVVRKPPRTA